MNPNISFKSVHLIISGLVQGVSFRAWTVNEARNLNLVGWVKNKENGDVEIYAEGKQKDLEVFINRCYSGPRASRVSDISVKWEKAHREFSGFEVVY